jgi:hypothetical protein
MGIKHGNKKIGKKLSLMKSIKNNLKKINVNTVNRGFSKW